MPYKILDDLPDSVKSSLPKHGQEIYRSAFNSAWSEYGLKNKEHLGRTSQDSEDSEDTEEVAHRVAWAAVKQKYVRVREGVWKAKD